jgi:hypothetical protein
MNGTTTHRTDSFVTFRIDIFQKSANSFVSRVRERSSEDLVPNHSEEIQLASDLLDHG